MINLHKRNNILIITFMIELVVNLFKNFEIILVFDVAELSLSRTIYSFPLEIHFHVSLGSVLMGKDYE